MQFFKDSQQRSPAQQVPATKTVSVHWDDSNQHILHFEFTEGWTWTDLTAAKAVGNRLIEERNHDREVGIIFTVPDFSRVSLHTLANMRRSVSECHSSATVLVMVTRDPVIKTVWAGSGKLDPASQKYYGLSTTIEQGRIIIQQRFKSTPTS